MVRIALIALVASTTMACEQQKIGPSELAETISEQNVEADMLDHFSNATLAQTAIINADMVAVRRHAKALSAARFPNEPASSSFLAEIETLSVQLSAANDPGQAALTLSQLAAQCGACHAELQVVTGIPVQHDIPDSSGAAGMHGHIWAADRLWEGLIGPSDDAWMQGATVLRYAPLTLPVSMRQQDPEVIAPLRSQIRDIGAAAIVTFDRDRQAELYGRLLPLCAQCHSGFRTDAGRSNARNEKG